MAVDGMAQVYPLSLTPLPGVRAVPAAQPQPLNPILKIISVKRSSYMYQSFFDSRKLVLLLISDLELNQ
jgi:hypothetical protein